MEVYVTCRVIGFHCWSNAPVQFDYLKPLHRHEFVIYAKKKVNHNDRDIEINQLKQDIEFWLHEQFGNPCEFGSRSCENIASLLATVFGLSECTVLEDGLCGAVFKEGQ